MLLGLLLEPLLLLELLVLLELPQLLLPLAAPISQLNSSGRTTVFFFTWAFAATVLVGMGGFIVLAKIAWRGRVDAGGVSALWTMDDWKGMWGEGLGAEMGKP